MINGWQCGGLNEEDELSYEELMYIKQCYADAVQDELDLIEGVRYVKVENYSYYF